MPGPGLVADAAPPPVDHQAHTIRGAGRDRMEEVPGRLPQHLCARRRVNQGLPSRLPCMLPASLRHLRAGSPSPAPRAAAPAASFSRPRAPPLVRAAPPDGPAADACPDLTGPPRVRAPTAADLGAALAPAVRAAVAADRASLLPRGDHGARGPRGRDRHGPHARADRVLDPAVPRRTRRHGHLRHPRPAGTASPRLCAARCHSARSALSLSPAPSFPLSQPPTPFPLHPYGLDTSRPSSRTNRTRLAPPPVIPHPLPPTSPSLPPLSTPHPLRPTSPSLSPLTTPLAVRSASTSATTSCRSSRVQSRCSSSASRPRARAATTRARAARTPGPSRFLIRAPSSATTPCSRPLRPSSA